jgi:hypothetical protein
MDICFSTDGKYAVVCGDNPHGFVLLNLENQTIKGRVTQSDHFEDDRL